LLIPELLLVLLASAALGQQPAIPTRPPTLVIHAGTLIDPETGTATANQTIIVEDRTITAVGSNLPVASGASVIDLSKQVVLPGLFDAHTHLCIDVNVARDSGNYFLTTLQDPDSYRSIQGVVNARSMLDAGFTTVRDVGNEGNYACSSVRRAIDNGMVVGPTILNAGRILAPFGGQFQLQPDRPGLAEPEYAFADTHDAMRKAVRENIHFGARVIKLVVDDQRYIYSEEDIRLIVDEAAKAGLKVAAHVWTRAGAHNAIEAGVATLEHLNGIADDDLALAKRRGVVAVFTPFPEAVLRQLRPADRVRAEFEHQLDRLRVAHRIGVAIAFGTDAISELPGLTRGSTAMQWLDSYATAGLPPRDVVRAMTANAARALGLEHERGAIRPGLAADIIATAANPLDDLQALKAVTFVMKNGQIVKDLRR
jgi:imidazolonepropionase-like amidohydrolase